MKRLSHAMGDWKPARVSSRDPVALLAAGWSDIVGDEVARHSHPARLDDGTLLVTARSNAWSQQLSFLSERVVEAVRARMPQVRLERLRFRVGKLPEPATRPERTARNAAQSATSDDRPPVDSAGEALARFRDDVEGSRRAKLAAAWKECERCTALIAPGTGTLCGPCENARAQERAGETARLLFDAPWLGYAGTAALVKGLSKDEYESVRLQLLTRWWDALSRAVAAKRLSPDGRERLIASSYVLLRSGLAPERIAPATVRNVLGDELHDLIYGTETN
jgi:hypothetical protein